MNTDGKIRHHGCYPTSIKKEEFFYLMTLNTFYLHSYVTLSHKTSLKSILCIFILLKSANSAGYFDFVFAHGILDPLVGKTIPGLWIDVSNF